jgi:hypothetical protein
VWPVAADLAMELFSLLVRAVGEADPTVVDLWLRAEEVAAPSPSTPAREPAICHRDPLPHFTPIGMGGWGRGLMPLRPGRVSSFAGNSFPPQDLDAFQRM